MIHNYKSDDATSSEQCSNAASLGGCPEPSVFATPTSGTQSGFPTHIVLSSDVPDAIIRYTTDGTEPDSLSTIYTVPILIGSSGVLIRAVAHTEGCPIGPSITVQYSNPSFPFVFSYACDQPDKGGQWDVFTPDGGVDHHWIVQFTLAGATTIKRLEIYQLDAFGKWTTGQVWSTDSPINPVELTDPFACFPLLLFIAAVQQHVTYQSSLGSFGAGSHTWDLYGDTVIAAGGLFRLDIILGDDTKLTQTIEAVCTATPPLCPPPATPTAVGGCGQVAITFSGTVGRPYVIYAKSDTCIPEEGWQEAASGNIDISPKTVAIIDLLPGCLYQFYVSIDEAGCGFKDSNTVTEGVSPRALVSISTDKVIVDPDETFTISWDSTNIGGTTCGGCADGEVSITQGIGCKPGNVAGSQLVSQAVCGVYTYQITGCNTCLTHIASVDVEVRCVAACTGPQPFRVFLVGADDFLCGNYGTCGTGFFVSEFRWDGTMYPQVGSPCSYASPTSGEGQKFLSGCIEPVSTIWGGNVLDAIVFFVPVGPYDAGPYFQLSITGQTAALSNETVWVGIKTVGDNPVGNYTKVDGCAAGPASLSLAEVLPP